MGIIRHCLTCLCIIMLALTPAAAGGGATQLTDPEGKVILTLDGSIAVFNKAGTDSQDSSANQPEQVRSLGMDITMLESIGLTTIHTETPWTEGLVEFSGVLMRDLMAHVKAEGSSIHASALDDYIAKLPLEDFQDHDVILATRIAGKPIRVRNNGPLWIIYPWSDVPDLRRPHYYARSIWQLKSITVQP